ncbi:MAG: beta-hydroxyacyl-ACP dehydratase [Planctomycetota bacterium]|jgi:3-hydroxyacyl-[acyl-carrier-protein] dehydratase|nr:beta-hydroxyacyl-ACP dehydratase [Planctomycetota bacterium]
MASPPLVDLDSLDLSETIATHGEVYAVLEQSGRFALLDGVLHRDADEGLIVGFKDIRADDWWAPDHIPGRPIFPGALMIEAGAQLCSYDSFLRRADAGESGFFGFGGLNGTRFRGVVEPGMRLLFVAKLGRLRRTMFTYQTQGFVEDKLVFEAEVMGVAI